MVAHSLERTQWSWKAGKKVSTLRQAKPKSGRPCGALL